MSTNTRSLITDIKAAARIGHPESMDAALDGLRFLPDVAANHPMSDEFINKTILPIAAALAASRIELGFLQSLAKERSAALRAVSGASIFHRVMKEPNLSYELIEPAANDNRSDVRISLSRALTNDPNDQVESLLMLIKEWLASDLARLQIVALNVVTELPKQHKQQALNLLGSMSTAFDPDVRAALVAAITSLAEAGHSPQILELLKDWSLEDEPNYWVIARALSASWVAKMPAAALEILERLTKHEESAKQVANALQALDRHGASDFVQAAMQRWQVDENINLRDISKRVMEKQD